MSEQDNRRLVEEQFSALNAHDLDRYAKAFADSHVWQSDTFPAPVRGPEGAKQAMGIYFKAFPDLHLETEQIIASGDYLVLRWRATGTHQGEYAGVAPSNRRVSVHGCTVTEIKNGRAVRSSSYWDQLTLLQQIGVLAAKGVGAR